MPTAPKRFTLHPPRDRHKERTLYQGSASERGYDTAWKKLRASHVAEHPLCEDCLQEGVVNPEQIEVDHVQPFHGKDDPLRLDPNNLRSLCKRHHQLKTQREQRTGSH